MAKMKAITQNGKLIEALQGISDSLVLIAKAQCRLASLPHPDLDEAVDSEAAFMGTDRELISERRAEAEKRRMHGIKDD